MLSSYEYATTNKTIAGLQIYQLSLRARVYYSTEGGILTLAE